MSYAVPVLEEGYTHSETNIILPVLVGVYEWERADVRPLIFCLRIDSAQPLYLGRALIEQRLVRWLAPCRYRLLEALAEHLINDMRAEWHCKRIVLEIEKPGALGDLARVGVRLTRHVG
ncbi:MAG: dihydroneopterin aldolase [Gallionella sp.]|jgi:dihydroneopterin aldolase|nr:dihydroneopterin aldolase [Gallionella sp.]